MGKDGTGLLIGIHDEITNAHKEINVLEETVEKLQKELEKWKTKAREWKANAIFERMYAQKELEKRSQG